MAARVLLALTLMVAVACTRAPADLPDPGFWPFTPERLEEAAPRGEPIKVGAVFSTSGGIKWLDEAGLRGFRLAAEEINQTGGVLGRPIRVVHVDAATHPLSTVEAVEAMIARGVVALGGLLEPTYALAPLRGAVRLPNGGLVSFDRASVTRFVAPVAARAGIPLVAGSADPGDEVFQLTAGFGRLVRASVDHAYEQLDARRVWLLTDDGYRYTADLAEEFRRAWRARGGSIAGDEAFDAGGARHIDELLGSIGALDPPADAIFLAAVPNELGILMDEIRAAGLTMPVLSSAAFDSPYIGAFAEQRADGLWLSADVTLLDPHPRMRTFIARARRATEAEPTHAGVAMGYDMMRLIGSAIERAGSAEPRAIHDALAETTRFPVLGGTLSFVGPGVAHRSVSVVHAQQGELTFVSRG